MTPEAARVRLDIVSAVGLLMGAIVAWVAGFIVAIIADVAFPAGIILLGLIVIGIIGTIVLLAMRRRAAWAGGVTLGVVVLGWVVAVAAGALGVG